MKLSLFLLIAFTIYMIYIYYKQDTNNKIKKNNFSFMNSPYYKRYDESKLTINTINEKCKRADKEENKISENEKEFNEKFYQSIKKSKESNINDYYIKKGQEYEYKIKCYFDSLGYNVYPNGYINGKKDKGIDLIAYKNNEVHLIQCKCYKNPPKQDLLRMFVGDCEIYIKNNQNKLNNKTIYKDFITSCKEKDYGVIKFLEENKNLINYLIIK
ncbi:restriction endonuclease [Campylobacter sp. Cr9]|uniref:restriction endonuclease n=1 Tax=Campylobacter sp. Cr9 TaxID=2735728 RepID=UPI00301465F0|nr:restriction endonuclease [Campylobacter sp. Cr9]